MTVCPQPAPWSLADRQRLADELERLPDGSVLIRVAVDYFRIRAGLRACRGGAP